jgi:hypothetical protein
VKPPTADPPMEFVKASELAPTAPPDLWALRFFCRPASGEAIRLCAVGDIGLHGRALRNHSPEECLRPFQEIAPLLKSADIVFGNLESVLSDAPPVIGCYTSPPETARALAASGFTVLQLANNHVCDCGAEGCGATLHAVADAGLKILGAGQTPEAAQQLLRSDVAGLKIGWLGCARTLQSQPPQGPCFWEYEEEALIAAIRRSRPELDVLIVSIHAGFEGIEFPAPQHKAMGERCLAEGAALVLMHHSHVVQGVHATAAGRVACYGLGNFLFDSEGGHLKVTTALQERSRGMVFLFDLDRDGVCQAAAIPVRVDDAFVVRWASGSEGLKMLEHLVAISRPLDGDIAAHFRQQYADRCVGPALTFMWHHLCRGHWKIFAHAIKGIRPKHVLVLWKWIADRGRTLVGRSKKRTEQQ